MGNKRPIIQMLITAGAVGMAAACSPAGAAVVEDARAEVGDSAALCAVHQEWADRLDAGADNPTEWAELSLDYLAAIEQVAPAEWQDEIALMTPYWERQLQALDVMGDTEAIHSGAISAQLPEGERAARELEAFTAESC
jgi:hypothetical protein